MKPSNNPLEWAWLGQFSLGTVFRPAQDPLLTAATHLHSLGQPGRLLRGRVVDAIAYSRFYKVQLEGGSPPLACCDAQLTSTEVTGARSLTTYVPGSYVLVWVPPQSSIGIIIASVPSWLYDPASTLSDFIVQGSNVGLPVDGVHLGPYVQNFSGLINWSGGRPRDALMGGEWGAITETGLGIFLDPWMGYLRVDEETGIFVFYQDQRTRLTGHNLEVWSAGCRRSEVDDQGEWNSYTSWTPYLWEALGIFLPGKSSLQSVSSGTLSGNPWLSTLEPAVAGQTPFPRVQEFAGYLGQGGHRYLNALPWFWTAPYWQRNSTALLPGLWEEATTLDGSYFLRSAKMLVIGKDPWIAVPWQLCRPEDPSGDTLGNYKFAGVWGQGPPHLVPDPAAHWPYPWMRLSSLEDQYAYLTNWKGSHPFFYHNLDWSLPSEGKLPPSAVASITNYALLLVQQLLPAPLPVALGIDARYGEVLYFPNRAFLDFLEDGGVVLADGWGSELRMSGGSIWLNCSGDLWHLPGRNLQLWAGQDLIAKANRDIQISSSNGDVRLKADFNILGLAGNSGCGGFLWESRALVSSYVPDLENPALGGFTVRCPHSNIAFWGSEVLVSTAGTDRGPGHIVFDSGTQKIIHRAGACERIVDQYAADFFAAAGPGPTGFTIASYQSGPLSPGAYQWCVTAIMPSSTSSQSMVPPFVGGETAPSAIIAATLLTSSQVTFTWNAVMGAVGYNLYRVAMGAPQGSWTLVAQTFTTSAVDDGSSQSLGLGTVYGVNTYSALQNTLSGYTALYPIQGPQGVGNMVISNNNAAAAAWQDTLSLTLRAPWMSVEFVWPSPNYYGTTQWVLPEARWQEWARLQNVALPVWLETVAITSTGLCSYPYPGTSLLTGSFFQYTPQLVGPTGVAIDRNPSYVSWAADILAPGASLVPWQTSYFVTGLLPMVVTPSGGAVSVTTSISSVSAGNTYATMTASGPIYNASGQLTTLPTDANIVTLTNIVTTRPVLQAVPISKK